MLNTVIEFMESMEVMITAIDEVREKADKGED